MNLFCRVKQTLRDKEQRLIYTNIGLSIFFKFLSMCLSIVNTKLYIIYFDNNIVLGGWYALVTILNWIINFDLGIGNGLRNGIVIPFERKEHQTVKKYISSGYVIVGFISAVIFVIGSILAFLINWNKILNVSANQVDNKTLVLVVVISLFGVCMHFLLKVITSITNALRKTFVSGVTALATNIIIFSFLYFTSVFNVKGSLLDFSVVYAIASSLPLLIVTVIVFITILKKDRPSIKLFDKDIAKKIASLGIAFFVIQVALMLVSSTDSWLISYFYSPVYTVDYQLYYRFFSIALTVYAMFSQTVWSSVTKYKGEKNDSEILKLYRMLNIVALLGGLASLIVAVFLGDITDLLMQSTYHKIEFGISVLFVLYFFIQMLVNASTAIANGLGKLKCQMIFVPIAGVLKILLVVLFSAFDFGWYSVVISNAVCLLPLCIAQYIAIRKELKLIREDKK